MFKRFTSLFSRFMATLEKHPATSFFVMLVLLFGTIALGHFLRTPETPLLNAEPEAKETAVFDLSHDTAFATVPAKVKKESITNIVALTSGIVSNILTTPGRTVFAGQTLLTLSNDYQSGGVVLQKKLAEERDRLTLELAKLDKDIQAIEEKRIKGDSALSGREEDIALAQLKKDRLTRKSTLEQSALGTQVANVSDAVLKPKIFATGTVQSIRVTRGDLVSPGQVLATIATPKGATTIEAFLDPKTAHLFDATKEATLPIGNDTLTLLPTYFSQSENENGLFSVLFTLSDDVAKKITDGEYLRISLPLKTNTPLFSLIPIDALFQDESSATVLVERDGVATTQMVTLGNLYGSFAEVTGLENHDRIILSRAVIAGDRISVK
jgi:biotin carboxyl carrier protein